MAATITKKQGYIQTFQPYKNLPYTIFHSLFNYLITEEIARARSVCRIWNQNAIVVLQQKDSSICTSTSFPPGYKSFLKANLCQLLSSICNVDYQETSSQSEPIIFLGERRIPARTNTIAITKSSIVDWNLKAPKNKVTTLVTPADRNQGRDPALRGDIIKACQFDNVFVIAESLCVQVWDLSKLSKKTPPVEKRASHIWALSSPLVTCDLNETSIAIVEQGFQGIYMMMDYQAKSPTFQSVPSKHPITAITILPDAIYTASYDLTIAPSITVWNRASLQPKLHINNCNPLQNIKQLHMQKGLISILNHRGTLTVVDYRGHQHTLPEEDYCNLNKNVYSYTMIESFQRCGDLLCTVKKNTGEIFNYNETEGTYSHLCPVTPNASPHQIRLMYNLCEGSLTTLTSQTSTPLSQTILRKWSNRHT